MLGDDGLVSVTEIAQLRQAVVNPKMQTRTGKQAAGAAPGGMVEALNGARGRSEAAKAQMAEMDLAERLGRTLRRDDVEAAVAAAGNLLRQNAFAIAIARAEVMARIDDVREMERALEDLMREVLDKGVQALSLAAAPSEVTSAA